MNEGRGKPRCAHGDTAPRDSRGGCMTCKNARTRATYQRTASERQFVLGRGFVYVAQEPTITRYVVIRDGLVVWPLSTAAETEAADFGAAQGAARSLPPNRRRIGPLTRLSSTVRTARRIVTASTP
jgi:hypothetical protein